MKYLGPTALGITLLGLALRDRTLEMQEVRELAEGERYRSERLDNAIRKNRVRLARSIRPTTVQSSLQRSDEVHSTWFGSVSEAGGQTGPSQEEDQSADSTELAQRHRRDTSEETEDHWE